MSLEYYFVSFIDILGFADMVRKDCHSGNAGPNFFPRIKTALTETRNMYSQGEFRIIQFSDSIVLSGKFESDKEVFRRFLEVVKSLQSMLFQRKILCRGGIAHGKHTEEDDILFSQALVEAYRIESNMSQVPRILISQDLLELFSPDGLPVITDRDGFSFVDFLRDSKFEDTQGNLEAIEADEARTASVAAKIRWLSDYCRLIHPGIVSKSINHMVRH